MSQVDNAAQIQAEIDARGDNKKIEHVMKAHTPREEHTDLVVDFDCECSKQTCAERVGLTLKKYERIHRQNDRFVIAIGHQTPTVEKVVKRGRGFLVVQKYALPA